MQHTIKLRVEVLVRFDKEPTLSERIIVDQRLRGAVANAALNATDDWKPVGARNSYKIKGVTTVL